MSETIDVNGVSFSEVMKSLMEGKHAERPSWKEQGKYIVLMPGMQNIWQIMTIPNPNAGNWLPLGEDFVALDWLIK